MGPACAQVRNGRRRVGGAFACCALARSGPVVCSAIRCRGLPGTQARPIFRLQHLSAAFCKETKDGNQSMSTMERVVAAEPFSATTPQGARVIEKWYRFQWFESLVAIWIGGEALVGSTYLVETPSCGTHCSLFLSQHPSVQSQTLDLELSATQMIRRYSHCLG